MGVRFIAITDNYDSLISGYDMLFSIRNLFNEHYAQDISQKCQASFKAKQRQGEFVGAFPSYGYRKSALNKHVLEVDPYAAEIVKRIYNMYIQGYGKVRIASILNEEGVLCPAAYKKANGENYRNSNKLDSTCYWTYSTVNNVLNNEMYTGTMVQGKGKREMNQRPRLLDESEWIRVEKTHPAIVTRSTWDKVQKLLKQRTTQLQFEEHQSIFAGFLKCGDCGRAMAKKNHKDSCGRTYYTFQCGTYIRTGNQYCSSHYIREDVLKEILLNDLNQIIGNVSGLVEMYEKAKTECRKMHKTEWYETKLAKNEIALERVRKLKQKAFEEYALGTIQSEEYADYREQYVLEEERLEKENQELLNKKREMENGLILDWPWITELLAKKKVKELTREIVVEMIDAIYIYKDKRIKIVYNFSGEYEELMKNYNDGE